jgi:hypothetical protein
MSALQKFKIQVDNATKSKSPELRLSINDAKQILEEIVELQNKSTEVKIVESVLTHDTHITNIQLDGGDNWG